jgi:nucleotide-binding universal stress UspA family protein
MTAAVAPTTGAVPPVVLGTDFGPVSAGAERVAIRMAAAVGAQLVVVHAIDPRRLRLPGGIWRQRVDQVRTSRERDAAALVARARNAGVDARVLIWSGDPATCLLDAAQAEGASRVVLGSHGRGRLGRVIAGSVSNDVLEHAACAVEIVREDAE